jgi:hypothetical protein
MRFNYKTEFRYFDFDIPALPNGFVDMSWHNDICPKFERKYNETDYVTLWVNYADEDRRECGGNQFVVTILPFDDLCNDIEYVIETDSWDEAINAINKLFEKVKV